MICRRSPTSRRPRAIIERRFLLARLIEDWASGRPDTSLARHGGGNAAHALSLAGSLARLIDSFDIENVPLDTSPSCSAARWPSISATCWPFSIPPHRISPAHRRPRQDRSASAPQPAARPRGAPYRARRPGAHHRRRLDRLGAGDSADDGRHRQPSQRRRGVTGPRPGSRRESWAALSPQDAQFGLKLLLERLGLDRSAVRLLPGIDRRRGNHARSRLLSEAMRPAATTDRWR